ncbi:uncharacterized protein F5147DRAFT_657842 [Suillus discolor]|uniref:Uncharacterized protein n=1 Tax=Suillus discolor TaxID=1912936 RepID=A0A9P7JMU7_9AGAM|nr:uncharacterized protein F5147DRAFT_657842 [Suillus discolor]KAG2091835.1 hypothetical protein F5147DRAFT_657842 [Suillus discolor]
MSQNLTNRAVKLPVDKMDSDLGPDDMKRVSQFFISDKMWRHHHAELSHITRKHETIQCLSDLPYIAVLLDLNVVLDPRIFIVFLPTKSHTPQAGLSISDGTKRYLLILHSLWLTQRKTVQSLFKLEISINKYRIQAEDMIQDMLSEAPMLPSVDAVQL